MSRQWKRRRWLWCSAGALYECIVDLVQTNVLPWGLCSSFPVGALNDIGRLHTPRVLESRKLPSPFSASHTIYI